MLLGQTDVSILRLFVPTAEQDHQRLALLAKIYAVARSIVDAQLGHPCAHRFAIAQIPLTNPRQSRQHPRHDRLSFNSFNQSSNGTPPSLARNATISLGVTAIAIL